MSAAALVVRFYDQIWNAWDDEAVDSLLRADFTFRGSLGEEVHGRDGFRAYRDTVRAAFPDFHNEVVEMVAAGDRVAARLRYSGRHQGELAGFAPTGRLVTYDGAAFFRARDARLASAWVIGDLRDLYRQLGSAARPV